MYGDQGHADPVESNHTVSADAGQLLHLAAFLTANADEKKIWDANIRNLPDTDLSDARLVDKFLESKLYYMPMIERKKLWEMTAIISKKVRTEGWKISYGMRDKPTRDGDSGWYFGVGNESDDYVNDPDHLELWKIGSVLMYDQALHEWITAPYGTAIVRVDHDQFEIDAPEKEILFEKTEKLNSGSRCTAFHGVLRRAAMTNEQRAESLISQLGFDFETISKAYIVELLQNEIAHYQEGSSEYIRLLCGYLFCMGDSSDIPLLKKAKYGINMDVGCMIDQEWLSSLENGGTEDQYTPSRNELIQDFISYYKGYKA